MLGRSNKVMKITPAGRMSHIRMQTLLDLHKIEFIIVTSGDILVRPINDIQLAVLKGFTRAAECDYEMLTDAETPNTVDMLLN